MQKSSCTAVVVLAGAAHQQTICGIKKRCPGGYVIAFRKSAWFELFFAFFSNRSRAYARHAEELVITSEPMAEAGSGGHWRLDGWKEGNGWFGVEPP